LGQRAGISVGAERLAIDAGRVSLNRNWRVRRLNSVKRLITEGTVMRRLLCLGAVLAAFALARPASATGLLIPTEQKLPPLAMLNHHVKVDIDDQVAVTRVEQTFRNHTDRQLEATYIFPVPKGASVRKFSMWVDGKEITGELVEAEKARKIYTDIVSRTLDPGLLEYMGSNLLKLRVFPVPPKGDQKIALSFTSIADSDNGLVEYRYPLKTDSKAPATLEKFTLKVHLKSQHALQNIYSPSHAVTTQRPNDKEAVIGFEKDQALLDRDFQLFYTSSAKDVGLTALTHRPSPGQNGYFLLLVAPRTELSKSQQVPRDMIFVLDTSGSMRGKRMTQAQNALKYCLSQLEEYDRFAVLNFATTVNRFHGELQTANKDVVAAARKWVDGLEASGGTAIDDALSAALQMRPTGPSLSCSSPTAARPSARPWRKRSCRTSASATPPARASSRSESATTSTPPCSTKSRIRRGPSALTFASRKTSKPRCRASTARSATRCSPI
jgi:Ca-activated chloride channel homolog